MATPQLVRTGHSAGPGHTAPSAAALPTPLASSDETTSVGTQDRRTIRSWPLVLLATPAAVAVWSGWVGIGQLTGFGQIHPLPGIWNSLHLDSAITLPIGVESYAAYALRAWLASGPAASNRTRRFAKWSAIGSLLLGMAGQVAYHLLTEAGVTYAPWGITTAVACLPVLILGMAAGLTHLIRADASAVHAPGPLGEMPPAGQADNRAGMISPGRLTEAQAVAARLVAAGQRVSRRTLRAAGLHGSNAHLGTLARMTYSGPARQAGEGSTRPARD
jgi:hypothetical protein